MTALGGKYMRIKRTTKINPKLLRECQQEHTQIHTCMRVCAHTHTHTYMITLSVSGLNAPNQKT